MLFYLLQFILFVKQKSALYHQLPLGFRNTIYVILLTLVRKLTFKSWQKQKIKSSPKKHTKVLNSYKSYVIFSWKCLSLSTLFIDKLDHGVVTTEFHCPSQKLHLRVEVVVQYLTLILSIAIFATFSVYLRCWHCLSVTFFCAWLILLNYDHTWIIRFN